MAEGVTGCGDEHAADDLPPPIRFLHSHTAEQAHRYNELLSRLVGYRLQSVEFVSTYLQLSFVSAESSEAPVLTCETMPVVITTAGPRTDGHAGYADAIRALIDQHVSATFEGPSEGLRIEFDRSTMELRPTAAELTGPVVAMLSDFRDGRSMSWRPGGDAFEYLGQA